MIESNLGVSLFILLTGGTVLSYIAYNNCYLPVDQKRKAQYITETVRYGGDIDYYDDCIVCYRYHIGKEKIKALATLISIAAAFGLVASNATEMFDVLKSQGWIGIMSGIALFFALVLVAFVVRYLLYGFVMRYEKMGAKIMHDAYYRDGVYLIEYKKNEMIEELIEESR